MIEQPCDPQTPPVFIVGCARSGTTLLRAMLDNHAHVAVPVESLFMIDFLRVRDRVPMQRVRRLVLAEFEFREWEVDVSLDELQDQQTVEDLLAYLHVRYAEKHGKCVWGQKTPRFIRYGELIKSVYPDAKFVHIIRDPRAATVSMTNSEVHRSNTYYGAKRWLKDVSAGRDLNATYPDDVLEIYYEGLVREPEATLHTVTDFLGLPYDPDMLSYHESAPGDYSDYHARIHKNLMRPPSPDRIDAWRRSLSEAEISLVEEITLPLMQEVGYEPDANGVPVPPELVAQFKRDRIVRGFPQQLLQYFKAGRGYHVVYSLWRKYRLGLLRDVVGVNY